MNRIIHFEIPANDLQKEIEFYKKVFGWNIQPGIMREDASAGK
jgi:predicted enzyme related to lactoylglutathione lyase